MILGIQTIRLAQSKIIKLSQFLKVPIIYFFEDYKEFGKSIGFKIIESGPLVRSSYHADEQARAIFNQR